MSRVPHLVWHILHYSIVSNSINEYHDFGTIAELISYGSHSMNRKVDEDEIKEALSTIKTQAYPDVEKVCNC
jgi:2-haloacid dehalogenase